MTWQDMVFSLGGWVFVIALIPSLRGKEKPAFSTSLVTGVVLLIYAATYATLSLLGSSLSQFIVAFLWLILAYQKYSSQKKKN